MDEQIQVRASWSRPPWCRDDWSRVRLPGGPRFYCRNEVLEFGEGKECWVRAACDHRGEHAVEARILDYDGPGSIDSVPIKDVRWLAVSAAAATPAPSEADAVLGPP